MTYLLDTNVVSELRRSTCSPDVRRWYDSVRLADKYLSCITIGEIRYGIQKILTRDRPQAIQLLEWFNTLTEDYAERIVPVEVSTAIVWGRLRGTAAAPLPMADGLIAATALLKDWTLVTRNIKDVAGTGVRLLNPFKPVS